MGATADFYIIHCACCPPSSALVTTDTNPVWAYGEKKYFKKREKKEQEHG